VHARADRSQEEPRCTAHDLERAGLRVKPGDLLSLGTFLPFQRPRPGSTATVRYLGPPGDPDVTVSFEQAPV